ncbi:MAG TPA: response regulator transcription factor [Spirochaetota bacterium]|nr:response regulator transcription factor [Spirochaetota bacterium]HPP94022.1 response regulator transcription factor [Spirochaetota bacterium]HRU64340.1 response regulator transcription factor [Spirochaetota bacterium]
MKQKIALISKSPEVSDDIKSNLVDFEVETFKNIDSVNPDEVKIFFVDYDDIGASDSTQFYLSRLRKKILEIPVILIFRVNTIFEMDDKWFFNDFILYPFRKGELQARIKKLIGEIFARDEEIIAGHLRINFKEYTVYSGDEKLELTYKEFELLRLFLENKGVVFSRKDILERIWGMDYIGGTRTVDVHIRRLRSKIGDDFNSIIETVRNVGYKCK